MCIILLRLKEGRNMKILLVEDNQKHFEDAKAVLAAAGVEFIHAENSESAEATLRGGNGITHVITDLYMPAVHVYGDGSEEPCGISVALIVEELGIPFVICVEGNPNAPRHDWISEIGRRRDWPEIIGGVMSGKKKWHEALEVVTGKKFQVTT